MAERSDALDPRAAPADRARPPRGPDHAARGAVPARVGSGDARRGTGRSTCTCASFASSSRKRCRDGGSSTRTSGSATGWPPSAHRTLTSRSQPVNTWPPIDPRRLWRTPSEGDVTLTPRRTALSRPSPPASLAVAACGSSSNSSSALSAEQRLERRSAAAAVARPSTAPARRSPPRSTSSGARR